MAESLRQRARGLIDPEGGRGAGDGPGEDRLTSAPPPDDPARFEPVDASRNDAGDGDDAGRVVGEWFDPDRTELPPAERRAAADELRQAARRARDAIENQQVPRRRRDLVQRVFERVGQRAREAGEGSVAPQGRDANP